MTDQKPWYWNVKWIADFHGERLSGGRYVMSIIQFGEAVPIAAVPTGVEGYGREQGRERARFIASAPETAKERDELREECDRLRLVAQNRERSEEKMRAERDELRKALEKLIKSTERYYDATEHYFSDTDYDRDGCLSEADAELVVSGLPDAYSALSRAKP